MARMCCNVSIRCQEGEKLSGGREASSRSLCEAGKPMEGEKPLP